MKNLARAPRMLVAAAALLLGVMYAAPVWSIRLIAPQYPEGLGLFIRLNTITGVKEHDLQSINSLNHYIGMRPILPSAIPELRWMPWIVAALIVGGLLVAVVGRRQLLVAWMAGFSAICVAGMYDFWRWGYDYGHNLDAEQAVIVVPGMTYQPPLIGSKQLLNFNATSMPHVGAIAAGLALLLGVAAVFLAFRHTAAGRRSSVTTALATASIACAGPAHQIAFGQDSCAECHMLITDHRFGAQIILSTGKVVTFDSIECMYAYRGHARSSGERWVVTADHQGTLVPEADAQYRNDGALHPPMGQTYAVAR
jgi:copper chaperone NosL